MIKLLIAWKRKKPDPENQGEKLIRAR